MCQGLGGRLNWSAWLIWAQRRSPWPSRLKISVSAPPKMTDLSSKMTPKWPIWQKPPKNLIRGARLGKTPKNDDLTSKMTPKLSEPSKSRRKMTYFEKSAQNLKNYPEIWKTTPKFEKWPSKVQKRTPKFLKKCRSGARKSDREVSTRLNPSRDGFWTLFDPLSGVATPEEQLFMIFRDFSWFWRPGGGFWHFWVPMACLCTF